MKRGFLRVFGGIRNSYGKSVSDSFYRGTAVNPRKATETLPLWLRQATEQGHQAQRRQLMRGRR